MKSFRHRTLINKYFMAMYLFECHVDVTFDELNCGRIVSRYCYDPVVRDVEFILLLYSFMNHSEYQIFLLVENEIFKIVEKAYQMHD